MTSRGHRDLLVWQQAMDLAQAVYEATSQFPHEERYGLTSQMRRAAVSITSNIAEGSGRSTNADYNQFLRIAKGSLRELETQIELAKRLKLLPPETGALDQLATSVGKLLDRLIQSIARRSWNPDEVALSNRTLEARPESGVPGLEPRNPGNLEP